MIALLDVNVLVALAWPNHVHHRAAHRWFAGYRDHGWATCPITQAGFVRVSSNQRALPTAQTPVEALGLLDRIVTLPGHQFLQDDIDFTKNLCVDRGRLFGHRQVTDAHLLSIAMANRAGLATFDVGIKELLPAHARSTVVEIPAG